MQTDMHCCHMIGLLDNCMNRCIVQVAVAVALISSLVNIIFQILHCDPNTCLFFLNSYELI